MEKVATKTNINEELAVAMWLRDFLKRVDADRDREDAMIDKAFAMLSPYCQCRRCVVVNSWHGGWLSWTGWFVQMNDTGCLKGDRRIALDHDMFETHILLAKEYRYLHQ